MSLTIFGWKVLFTLFILLISVSSLSLRSKSLNYEASDLEPSVTETVKPDFKAWAKNYKVEFEDSADKEAAKKALAENAARILEHNNEDSSFKLGLNSMSGISREEYKSRLTAFKLPPVVSSDSSQSS